MEERGSGGARGSVCERQGVWFGKADVQALTIAHCPPPAPCRRPTRGGGTKKKERARELNASTYHERAGAAVELISVLQFGWCFPERRSANTASATKRQLAAGCGIKERTHGGGLG